MTTVKMALPSGSVPMQPPYRTFNSYLREYFGERVYRVPIDAGFTCPNRDGVRAFGGCTFCDDRGSGAPTINVENSVREQLEAGMRRIGKRYKAKKFLAYFQAFTNTYAPEGVLRSIYDVALEYPDVVGICIGTRPDCLEDNVLDLLQELSEKTFVWLEVGVQSVFNETLDKINRGHSAEEFFDAVERAKKRNLKVATHLIFGLPGEDESHMLETVRQMSQTDLDGIKIHQLCIYKGTPMEVDYRLGRLPVLDEDRYVNLVCDSLELLPPEMIIMRLVAEGSQDEIIAPDWAFEKERVMKKMEAELARRNSFQGKHYRDLVSGATKA
ncbi:MAG: TIGR01212 family radical SAM protein [Cyanobacteriota/Melainabacteria group bacterium]